MVHEMKSVHRFHSFFHSNTRRWRPKSSVWFIDLLLSFQTEQNRTEPCNMARFVFARPADFNKLLVEQICLPIFGLITKSIFISLKKKRFLHPSSSSSSSFFFSLGFPSLFSFFQSTNRKKHHSWAAPLERTLDSTRLYWHWMRAWMDWESDFVIKEIKKKF